MSGRLTKARFAEGVAVLCERGLKGGASNLRAHRLTRVASDLEIAAENEKTEEICKLIEVLAEEFQLLERYLRQKGL